MKTHNTENANRKNHNLPDNRPKQGSGSKAISGPSNPESPQTESSHPTSSQAAKKSTRIWAWIGIAVLLLLYLLTFLTAVLDFPGADRLFYGFLATSLLLPLLIWWYIMIYKRARGGEKE